MRPLTDFIVARKGIFQRWNSNVDQKEIHCQEWQWTPSVSVLKGSTGCLGLPFMRTKRKRSVAKRHSVGASLFWLVGLDYVCHLLQCMSHSMKHVIFIIFMSRMFEHKMTHRKFLLKVNSKGTVHLIAYAPKTSSGPINLYFLYRDICLNRSCPQEGRFYSG